MNLKLKNSCFSELSKSDQLTVTGGRLYIPVPIYPTSPGINLARWVLRKLTK